MVKPASWAKSLNLAIKMGGGKRRRERADRARKHAEYLREKERKRKERKVKLQAPVKGKKK